MFVQRETAKEDVAAAYVDIATSILMAPATKKTAETGMRCWVLKLLMEYSPDGAPIPDKLRKALLEGRVIASHDPPGMDPEGHQPQGHDPAIVADPECEL